MPVLDLPLDIAQLLRLRRIALDGRGRLANIEIREADLDRWDRDSRLLFELFNESFADRWGFVPLSWSEFEEKARYVVFNL